ncbi:NUDIX hydrolase [Luedemannella helvata]|uniref:NUDIX hydrolase n=2 Tax=Luedemannella helvata TaxID=349315 RepID=A0ABP4WR69_9ACTN
MRSAGDMSTDAPLYERDPAAYQAYLAEGNRTQPRKRVGADVIFRDDEGRILLVNPRYKPDWDLPGGMAEANEPPIDAARREVLEELGLDWRGGRLLAVDWVPPHGPWDDSLMFIFDGGVLSGGDIARITLADGELDNHEFCELGAARDRLRPYVLLRVHGALTALREGGTAYLHGGGVDRRTGQEQA